jgi:hypothetical protein
MKSEYQEFKAWLSSSGVVSEVAHEITRARATFSEWPIDPVHAAAVVSEECGELTRAVLQRTYEPHKASMDDVRKEAIQTAAMAIRFAQSIEHYKWNRAKQRADQSA